VKDVDRQQRLSELAKAIDNLCYFGTEYQDLKRKDFYAYGFRVTIGKKRLLDALSLDDSKSRKFLSLSNKQSNGRCS
jgi:hypothetical protein